MTRTPATHPYLHCIFTQNRVLGEFSTRESEKLPPEQQRSLLKAFEAAQQFAENPRSWLVFMGDYATGKTHLAAAIGTIATHWALHPCLW